eukprot:5567863-Pyramimonas_sp.AAC.1
MRERDGGRYTILLAQREGETNKLQEREIWSEIARTHTHSYQLSGRPFSNSFLRLPTPLSTASPWVVRGGIARR